MSEDTMYDAVVFIGRFQPFHDGHLDVVKKAFKIAKRLIIVIGSANQARNIKNPWTDVERMEMIRKVLLEEIKPTCIIQGNALNMDGEMIPEGSVYMCSVQDYFYNEARWVYSVTRLVYRAVPVSCNPRLAIVGYEKDHSSYYLKKFPQFTFVDAGAKTTYNATDIREDLYETEFFDGYIFDYSHLGLHGSTVDYITDWATHGRNKDVVKKLCREYEYVKEYKEMWKDTPYPVTFTAVDAYVVCMGKVLLIRRKGAVGNGQLAFPGGFINVNERLYDACVRELREETGLDVNDCALDAHCHSVKTFDHPDRSLRGRIITTVFEFRLPPNADGTLPYVKAADDAESVEWVAFEDIDNTQMFSDHAQIIDVFLQ